MDNTVLNNDVNEIVFRGIVSVLSSHGNWSGTMTGLSKALNRVLSKHQRTLLPSSPSTLRLVTNKVINRLRNRGISVKFGRTPDKMRTRFVKFLVA